MSTSKKTEAKPVLVTTLHRGVFFGYVATGDYDEEGKRIQLTRARNCVSWTADVRGFIGLAVTGPTRGCRVGPAANLHLQDVTSVVTVTPEAVERWEAAPWVRG